VNAAPTDSGAGDPAARVLIADGDARILELMSVALSSQGFEVIRAGDGDEALRLALAQRPDLLLLDEALARRSGIEVCEFLRRDPEEGSVPIVLLAQSVDAESRPRALARGADDVVGKPFSPKDLIARVRRLLARATELREARRRARTIERELHRAQDDARRATLETRRERRLRETLGGIGRELHRALDPDAVAGALLGHVRDRLRVGFAALMVLDEAGERLRTVAVHGDGWERVAGLDAPVGGEMATLLGGLARPAARRDLERFPELRDDLAPFVACGVRLLAALVGPEGVEGLLVADERPDGLPIDPAEIESLTLACEVGGLALFNARRVRAQLERSLELLSSAHGGDVSAAGRAEGLALAGHAAQALLVPPRLRAALRHAIALGRWADTPEGLHAVSALAGADATGVAMTLARLLARIEDRSRGRGDDPDLDRAAVLARIGARHAEARSGGLDAATALALALEDARQALDAATEQAVRAAARELDAAGLLEGRAA
jgi:DNA-binding response OmpR family regulator